MLDLDIDQQFAIHATAPASDNNLLAKSSKKKKAQF